MKTAYDTFQDDISKLPLGQNLTIYIRDLKEFETKKAVVELFEFDPSKDLDVLWVRYSRGRLRDKPFNLKIIKESDELYEGI